MAILSWTFVIWSAVVGGAIYILWALWNVWRNVRKRDAVLNQFPSLKKHWLLGNTPLFPGFNDEGMAYLRMMGKEFPRTSGYWDHILHAVLHVRHPDLVKLVLKRSDPKPTEGGIYGFGRAWLGDGLILSNGRKWERHRKLLTNAFHFDILRPYVKVMNEATEKVLVMACCRTGEKPFSEATKIKFICVTRPR